MSPTTKFATVGLCLEPLDILFFRDGRPFGTATRATSGQPMPQTLAGALRTALLAGQQFPFERLAERVRRNHREDRPEPIEQALKECGAPEWIVDARVRGPFLARLNGKGGIADVLVPAPAILHRAKNKPKELLYRLNPLKEGALPGWSQQYRPLWLRHPEATEAVSGYLTTPGLRQLLEGGTPEAKELVPSSELFGLDHRTGIVIAPDQLTAQEGGIYGATFLALRGGYTAAMEGEGNERLPAVGFYAELVFSQGAPPDCAGLDGCTLPLGGEGRRVAVRRAKAWEWPELRPSSPKQKSLVVLTTPGLFQGHAYPALLRDKMVAVAVPGATAVSGWDLARGGPKPNRFAAAAGSVYFLESLPENLSEALSDREEDRAQGWGCYLKGVWTDE